MCRPCGRCLRCQFFEGEKGVKEDNDTHNGGYRGVFRGTHTVLPYRFPRAKSLRKLKETIRAKTRQTDRRSLLAIIADVNQTLRG